jgi:hypothetical protein
MKGTRLTGENEAPAAAARRQSNVRKARGRRPDYKAKSIRLIDFLIRVQYD